MLDATIAQKGFPQHKPMEENNPIGKVLGHIELEGASYRGPTRKGATVIEATVDIMKYNGGYAHVVHDEEHNADHIVWIITPKGKVVTNLQFYVDGGLAFVEVDDKIVWVNGGNVLFPETANVRWQSDDYKTDMPDIRDEKKKKNANGACMGGEWTDTGKLTTSKIGIYDPLTGMVTPPPRPLFGEELAMGENNLLPPQYFRQLTTTEPRGFETQTGFVPGAALVQDRAGLGAMAWLRVAALKADGELGIARYYDAIGERGIGQMPARVEAAALPQAEESAFVASSEIVQGEVQECRAEHAPAAQEAPVRFAYDSSGPEQVRFRKERKQAEKPVEEGNAAKTENRVERKGENPARNDDSKVESKPSAKPAHGETPFWRIDRKGRMKPLNAPIELDEDAPAPMPKLKLAIPKITGRLMPARMKAPVARQKVAEKEAKNPALPQERKKKRRKRPEMARAETERRAEKPKMPAAKVRFGDAAPLSSGIKRKNVRREMPAVELKKEKKARRKAEKREMKIKPELTPAAIAKQKARRREKKMVLGERGGEKRAAKRRAERKHRDTVEYLVAKRAPKRGKRKYWAPLSRR